MFPSFQARFISANEAMDKKEMAQEKDWISRREREVLAKMLEKMEAENKDVAKTSSEALDSILKKHRINVTAQLVEDLKNWRRSTY